MVRRRSNREGPIVPWTQPESSPIVVNGLFSGPDYQSKLQKAFLEEVCVDTRRDDDAPAAVTSQRRLEVGMKSGQLDSSRSPRFAQPATFMRLPHQTDVTGVDVAILGVPFDSGTSYRPGARLGPREIRAQSSLIRPYSYFLKVSPFERLTIVDAGDVDAQPVGIE